MLGWDSRMNPAARSVSGMTWPWFIMLVMKRVDKTITLGELEQMAKSLFGDLVKAVVDVEKKVMVVNGELHADEEQALLQSGSTRAFVGN